MAWENTGPSGRLLDRSKKLTGTLPGTLEFHYSSDAEHYTGDYEVVPSSEAVVLPTEKKYMDSDVTVHAIPFFSVGNNAGGNTVYIGSEKEISIT